MHYQPGMRRAALAACLSLTGILGAQEQEAPAKADPSVVMTDTGAVAGTIGAGVREHKGIPFAAPPVGELRWAPPRPAAPWSGVHDATRYRGLCPQTARYGIPEASVDEDCLYLNVTTPTPGGQVLQRKRPVILWIHGGAFVGGSSGLYDLSALATAGDAVVVSMNYRLGVFGFMPHPAFDPATNGAYGLQDQRAALRWVQRNIAAFGGDPDNVTIAGSDLLAFAPVYGTPSQPLQGDEALATGRFVRVPLIQGGNTQEQRLYVAYALLAGQLTTRDNFHVRLAQDYGDQSARVAAEYPLRSRSRSRRSPRR